MGAAVGATIGWFRRPSDSAVAQSIDRRASLKDRLSTALELGADDEYAAEVQQDAVSKITTTDPKNDFPGPLGLAPELGAGHRWRCVPNLCAQFKLDSESEHKSGGERGTCRRKPLGSRQLEEGDL